MKALSEVSGGRLQVEVETDWGEGSARAEADLVRAIGRGDVDGGWPSTRAFAEAGIPGLAALEAPLTITTYADERRIATGEAGDLALKSLDETDLVGLGLTVGPLRRPFGVDGFAWFPSRLGGHRRSGPYGSPMQDAAIRALGATPRRVGRDLDRRGPARGCSMVPSTTSRSTSPTATSAEAPYVTANLVLWPKMYLLTLSRHTWDDMSDQQRAWVRDAAQQAVDESATADYEEPDIARRLCDRGVRFRDVAPRELRALRTAWWPLLRHLAADPAERPLMDAVRDTVGPNPSADPLRLDEACYQDDVSPDHAAIPTTLAPVPDGTYRKQITADDVAAAGLTNNDGLTGTWTLTVKSGRYELRCRPLDAPGTDCGQEVFDGPLDIGELRGDDHDGVVGLHTRTSRRGDRLPAARLEPPGEHGHCNAMEPYRMSWHLDGDDLVFSDATGGAGEATLKAYRRIG